MNWQKTLSDWETKYNCKVLPPVESALLNEVLVKFDKPPLELLEFYKNCNGIELDWFKVLPVEDPNKIKDTWDGLKRANSPRTTKFLNKSEELLNQFFVFASLDAGKCAVMRYFDNSIWYEENNELYETELAFDEFIETCLREVTEL